MRLIGGGRLIRGAPGSGKTALVFREFKEALRSGASELRIVVPTATLVRHFQHELARDGVVFSPRCVVSLSRFISERAAGIQPDAVQIPDNLLRAVVRDALERLGLAEFTSVATTDGMTTAVIETIELFENAGCTPETAGLSPRKGGQYAKPFDKLWRAVRDGVHQRGFLTRSDLIRLAATNNQPSHVWLDGFLNFSPIEQEFVRALAATCDVTLTTTDSQSGDEIRKLALRLGAKETLLKGAGRKARAMVVAASTLEREADEIARRILSLHDQGMAFRDIGVALRDASNSLPLLEGTFARFGIPARFYFSSPLSRHPAAIFLGGLVSGALNNWDFEPTIEALRAHPRWGTRPDFDRFDFAVRAAMPGHGASMLLELCESDRLREYLSDWFKIESWKNTPQKPAEWQRLFEAFARSVYRPAALQPAQSQTDLQTARSHTTALREWIATVGSVVPFWSEHDEPIPLEEFWKVTSNAIDSAVLRPIDDRTDVVHVMSVYEARQWDVASLFVCGLTDQDFPRQHAQNLFFPDPEIERLRLTIRRAADQAREERDLFQSLLTRARDSLFLSYPEHDIAGKSAQCSRFLRDESIGQSFGLNAAPEPARLAKPAPLVAPWLPDGRAPAPGHISAPELHMEMTQLHQSIRLTALEDLAQCRFKFFGGRTLALKPPPDSPEKRLQPKVTGSILHATLERWLLEDRKRDFVELFEAIFDEECRRQHIPPGYRLEVERIKNRAIARRINARDKWPEPDSWQVEVPLTLQFPGGIEVNGRVDRIDQFGNDCVIVDYKSSKTQRVKNMVTSSTRLQGPLYALAVRDNLGLNPVAMVYWAVRDDTVHGWGEIPGYKSDDLQEIPENWAEDAQAHTIERLSGFLSGAVHPFPENPDECRWCEYRAACRFAQGEEKTTTAGADAR